MNKKHKKILNIKDCKYHSDYEKMVKNYPEESMVYDNFRTSLARALDYAKFRWFDVNKRPVLPKVNCSKCSKQTKPRNQIWIHFGSCPDRSVRYNDYDRRDIAQRSYSLLCTQCFRVVCKETKIPYKIYDTMLSWDSIQFRDMHNYYHTKASFVERLSNDKYFKKDYETLEAFNGCVYEPGYLDGR